MTGTDIIVAENARKLENLIEDAAGLDITIPAGEASKIAANIYDVIRLVESTKIKTAIVISNYEHLAMHFYTAIASLTSVAFCTWGEDTRHAIQTCTDTLVSTTTRLQDGVEQIRQQASWLQPDDYFINEAILYANDLRDHARAYYNIVVPPSSAGKAYHSKRREALKALDDLRRFIETNSARFAKIELNLTGPASRPEIRRYLRDLAQKEDPYPVPGEHWKTGKQIYDKLARYRRPSQIQRQALEALDQFFVRGEVRNKTDLGVFISSLYDLK